MTILVVGFLHRLDRAVQRRIAKIARFDPGPIAAMPVPQQPRK